MKKAVSAGGILVKFENDIPKICLVKLTHLMQGFVFPKGHLKLGETKEEAAKREVKEETGVKNFQLKEYLGVVTRESVENYGTKVIKDIHLYLMLTNENIHTQAEEDFEWVTLDQALNDLVFKEEKEFLLKHKNLIMGHKNFN